MANPTTYFGWVMPTSSSLVTNLPADFNTFGQGVDTSMQDLLGGTTGQVLSKTSGTNMDFTWVTPTDQTPLTTKGDLFTFTTVDARLGVGVNLAFLQADSAEATGLKWASDWTSFTPTITATTGSPTTITPTGGYIRIGKACIYRFRVVVTNVGTATGNMLITLPFAASAARQIGTSFDSGLTGYSGFAYINNSGVMAAKSYDNTSWWVNSSDIIGQITYEVA